jgi:hypothetical protein
MRFLGLAGAPLPIVESPVFPWQRDFSFFGGKMKYYEIRVFNRRGRASLVFHQLLVNDSNAIRVATEIAEEQAFEVWRGMECIHAAGAKAGPGIQ